MDQQILIELIVAVVPAVALAWFALRLGHRWEERHPDGDGRGTDGARMGG